ncbi:MAG: Uma2 family endonuclease, partial [Aquificota bacterium]
MKTAERLYTYQDLVQGNLPDGLYEIVKGEVVEMAPTGGWHGEYEASMVYYLKQKAKRKAHVVCGEVG